MPDKIDKAIETESRLVVARDWGQGRLWSNFWYKFSFWGGEIIVQLGSSDGYTTL